MRLAIVTMLMVLAVPAFAQTKRSAPAADVCAPIGRTARGELVYAIACTALPAPVPPPVAAAPPPASEPEIERSGIFGMSYTRKPSQ